MARSTDINQRIVLTGAEEVRKGLDQIAAAGQRSGSLTRQALLAALGPTSDFTSGINAAAEAHRGLSAQGQAVFHSMRSVTEQLALGVSPAQALTQQLNHLSFAATGPGGVSGALGELLAIVRGFITPTTAAVAGFAALSAGIGVLVARAASAQNAAREFDVILKGMGDHSGLTGKDLETAAHRLRDIGLSTSEAEKQMQAALREGVKAPDLDRVVRIGKDLNAVLGEGSLERFISAAGHGGEPLKEFARQLGIIPKVADQTQQQLDDVFGASRKFGESVDDVLRNTNRAIEDEQRQSAQQLADLHRQRGTKEEEIALASSRRLRDIERQKNRAINDLAIQSNRESRARLDAYNRSLEEATQKWADTQNLIAQIEQRVQGSADRILTPFQKTMKAVSIAWNDFMDSLANSTVIQALLSGFNSLASSIGNFLTSLSQLTSSTGGLAAFSPAAAALALFMSGNWKAAWDTAKSVVDNLWNSLTAIGSSIAQGLTQAFTDFVLGPVASFIAWVQKIIDKVNEASNAVSKFFGGGGQTQPAAQPPIPQAHQGAADGAQGLAGGGLVRGPGGPTGDRIPALLSDQEFVTRASAVRAIGAHVYAAFNADPERYAAHLRHIVSGIRFAQGGLASIADRVNDVIAVPHFAAGGLVTVGSTAAGGTAVHLHLDGRSFKLRGAPNVVDELRQHARQSQIVSAGRKPGYRS